MSTSSNSDSDATRVKHDGIEENVSLFDQRYVGSREIFLKSFLTVLGIGTLVMFVVLSIYWSTYFKQEENLYRLKIGIIDLDSPASAFLSQTPALGPALLHAVNTSNAGSAYHLGWEIIDNSPFDLSEGIGGVPRGVDVAQYAFEAVSNEDYYGIIIANANASIAAISAFNASIAGTPSSTPYSGAAALTLYYGEARSFDTYDQFIAPGMTTLAQKTMPIAGALLAKQFSNRFTTVSTANYQAVNKSELASVIASPFGFTLFNIHPLSAFAGIAATTIGQIYLLIFTYFISLFWLFTRAPIESKILTKHLIILRIFVPIFQYIFISLSISLISIAFGVPWYEKYGKGGFVLFWLLNFVTMAGSGAPMEISLALLGPPFTAFFLVFWIILNISTAFIDLNDMNHFYSYGFVMPIWNGVSGSKSILFGTKNHLLQNFAVNLAWVLIGNMILAFIVYSQRQKEVVRAEKEKEKEEKEEKGGTKDKSGN